MRTVLHLDLDCAFAIPRNPCRACSRVVHPHLGATQHFLSPGRASWSRFAVGFVALMSGLLTACATAQEPPTQAAHLLKQADSFLASGDYEQAAERAKQAAKVAGDSVPLVQRAAELLYLSGAAEESLLVFDRVVELDPESAPHNWQRGIALATCGKFAAGAAQFKVHHEVNPDDVENSAWYFLCVAKSKTVEAARQSIIPSRGDGREPMMSVLRLLRGEIEPEEVLQAAVSNTREGPPRRLAQFYAELYIGLYHDALGEQQLAAEHLRRSTEYGLDGYMAHTARVYLQERLEASANAESKVQSE